MNFPEALDLYAKMRVNVIPLRGRDKRPMFDWLAYQTRMSTPEERQRWWPEPARNPETPLNIGVVCGAISNLLVLDLDDEETYKAVIERMPWLTESMIVQTGRGFHIYLRPTVPAGATTTFRLHDKLHHVKSDGGYVVAPPSIHPSGSVYTFAEPGVLPMDVDPAVLVKGLLGMGATVATPNAERSEKPRDWVNQLLRTDVHESGGGAHGAKGRDDTAAQLAGWFRNAITHRPDITIDILQLWNEAHCKPPLPVADIERIVNHKYRRYPPPPAPLA